MSNPKKSKKIIVKKIDSGKRLDLVLTKHIPAYSRQVLASAIKQKLVKVDGELVASPSKKVMYRQIIEITLPKVHTGVKASPLIKLNIIFEDKNFIVINKPAGLVMHPAGKHQLDTLTNALKAKIKNFYLVHRLDKDTSGLVIVAKTIKARDFFVNLFKNRQIQKTYTALVKGKLTPSVGSIDAPIKRQKTGKFGVQSGGRVAKTYWKVKKYLKGCTLVEAKPATGRTHQIRVHFKALGHPIVGDEFYNGKMGKLGRQFLHASSIEFIDWGGQTRQFTAPLPSDLSDYLKHVKT